MNFFKSMAKDLGDALEEEVKKQVQQTNTTRETGNEHKAEKVEADEKFEEKVETAIPGLVRMISGCADHQTSADVSNTSSFQLPANSGPGGAGGACTNSMILALSKESEMTWVQLLDSMRIILKEKGYEQIPQLSSSRKIEINSEKMSIINPQSKEGSKRRAVLIGINYVGQRGELRGCHNDVHSMKIYIQKQGFQEDEIRVLMDDGQHINPTGKNILEAFDWLADDANPGDSLFLHYSGHGGYVPDTNGDEADGRDETIVPVDFQSSGQIIDDLIYKELVMPLPAGSQLTCVMDCCHSGSVFDLPFYVKATEQLEGTGAQMAPNPGFSFQQLFEIARKLYTLKTQGASNSQLASQAAKDIMPMLLSAKKPTGGLSNLFSMMGGSSGGKLPSLPF